jgi:hypothetical protein
MSTLRTNAILDASGGNTATINTVPLRPGVLDPENRIINGAFDFWQRGTSFTTAVYGADRWFNNATGGTVTMSRQAFALGDTLGSNNPTYFLRQTVSGQSTSGSVASINQLIEGVRSYAGHTITILGWARRSSGSGNMAVEPLQYFGTGGSPSSIVFVAPQTVTLTSSFAPFALTFSIPSIAGKTLGTNNNDYVAFSFWTSAGSNFDARTNSLGLQTIGVDLWGVHIKVGTHTTAATDLYKQPEFGPELARCQRYYEKSYNVNVVPGTDTTIGGAGVFFSTANNYSSGAAIYANILQYKVKKRTTPTLAFWAYGGQANQWHEGVSGFSEALHAAPLSQFPSEGSVSLYMTLTGASANNMYGHWAADAEL